jgi:hypothetical protein
MRWRWRSKEKPESYHHITIPPGMSFSIMCPKCGTFVDVTVDEPPSGTTPGTTPEMAALSALDAQDAAWDDLPPEPN